MLRTRRFILRLVLAAAGLSLAAGCRPPGGDRFTMEDCQLVAQEMSSRLRESRFMLERGPESPPLTLGVGKVLNLTSDMMDEEARSFLMQYLADSIPREQLDAKKLSFAIPPKAPGAPGEAPESASGSRLGVEGLPVGEPTHILAATIRSITRNSMESRTELYGCEYRITDRRTKEVVWTDMFEFKRMGVGKSGD